MEGIANTFERMMKIQHLAKVNTSYVQKFLSLTKGIFTEEDLSLNKIHDNDKGMYISTKFFDVSVMCLSTCRGDPERNDIKITDLMSPAFFNDHKWLFDKMDSTHSLYGGVHFYKGRVTFVMVGEFIYKFHIQYSKFMGEQSIYNSADLHKLYSYSDW